MKDLDIFQEEVKDWAYHNFPKDTFADTVLGLVEEVGEVCRTIIKKNQGVRGTPEYWDEEARKELGDVFIKLLHVMVLFDPSDGSAYRIASDRWQVIRKRDWVKYQQTGRPE